MSLSSSAHLDTFARDNLPPAESWPTVEFSIPDVVYPDRLNAATEIIDRAVELFGPNRPCLSTPSGETWTYGDVLAAANRVAHVLEEDLGLIPGNRVLLRGPNTPWIVVCWLAVLKAGGVVVTTMHALRAQEISPLIDATQPVISLVDHRYVDDLVQAARSTPLADKILSYGSADSDLTRLCESKPSDHVDVETSADDVALLGPTSGTTGRPKITMHFHRDLLANSDTFAKHVLKPQLDDVFTGTPPLAFTFGLGGLVVFPLRFGASTLLIERATPAELADWVAEFRVSVLFTAPTAYRAILRGGQAQQLTGLRVGVSAGEHLPAAVWNEVHEATGLELVNGIGSTELLHIFISAAGNDIRPGSTGKPVPGYRATILREDGTEADVDELGRLAVIGPTGCRYLNDARQANYVDSGWNVTGDTYRKDAEGYFWYEARTDSMIVSSGYNIGAPEVESALCQHPDVVESGVVAKPDLERGSLVAAFVVLRDGVTADDAKRKELQDFVKQTIAPFKYPRELQFVDRLPRNPSGKLQHFRLRELFETNTSPAAVRTTPDLESVRIHPGKES
jgi:2-aminobenzoate-CoA ligase